MLRLQRPGKGKLGRDARSGYGFGRGRGAGQRGQRLLMLAILGVSFLTPLDALFVLAAAAPLFALLLTERRAERVRRAARRCTGRGAGRSSRS